MNAEISTPTTSTTELAQRLSSTPRGARLARRLTAQQLDAWGYPHDTDANDTAQHLVAELAANSVTHGRVPGRDFELRLLLLSLPASTWGVAKREVGKTVWAELALNGTRWSSR